MASNSRFAVAVHISAMLAVHRGEVVPSDKIACSVNTNAVVIRRILGLLHRAKIVKSTKGKRGGSLLARRPEQITLLDIYQAVEDEEIFGFNENPHNKECPVSCCMQQALTQVFKSTKLALATSLKKITLASLITPITKNMVRN